MRDCFSVRAEENGKHMLEKLNRYFRAVTELIIRAYMQLKKGLMMRNQAVG